MSVEIRRGATRFVERGPGRATWHSFSFGANYDPGNLSFGSMVCHDEHLLATGHGFDTHRHSGLVIVSRVITGALEHTDSSGRTVRLAPGQTGVFTPGEGMDHAEFAAGCATRFIQVWLNLPDADLPQGYAVVDGDTLDLPGAQMRVHHVDAGSTATLPQTPRLHLFVASGALTRSSLAEPLGAGDAFRLVNEPGHEITAAVPATLLAWSL